MAAPAALARATQHSDVLKARLDRDVVFSSIVKRKPQYSQEARQLRNTWYLQWKLHVIASHTRRRHSGSSEAERMRSRASERTVM